MRIIAGEFRGRRIRIPASTGRHGTRPTTDRVREAWFNVLGTEIKDASLLDLFAGSGALGLEGLSRGASRVEFVDSGRKAVRTIRDNIERLGAGGRTVVHHRDAMRFAKRVRPGEYDIVLADPPFDSRYALELAELFRDRPFARIFCVEHRATLDLAGDGTRRYGDVAITFFQRL